MAYIDKELMLKNTEPWSDEIEFPIGWIREWIKAHPVVDAVPVVRCKDCVYGEEAKENERGFLICPASGMEIVDNDFCSYGERKEEAV